MKIRIEIEDKSLKSAHEFESKDMDAEILREDNNILKCCRRVRRERGSRPATCISGP